MIGFEVKSGKKKIIAANTGSTHLFFMRVVDPDRDEIDLTIQGVDFEKSVQHKWGHWKLKEGAEFEIRVVETENPTLAKRKEEIENKPRSWESKLKSYHRLKKQLEEKGLI